MADKDFMELAIKEAKKSKEAMGCGVVITKNGEVISRAYNTQRSSHDATAHAEINAIRKACKKLRSKNIEGATIYCTCEPCIMCLSAISYSRINKIFYGLSMKETYSMDRIIDIDLDTFLSKTPFKQKVIRGFMKDECRILLKE